MDINALFFTIIFLLLSILLFFIIHKNKNHQKPPLSPPSPPHAAGAWPIIGHLHLLNGKVKSPVIVLSEMVDKYGPIFTVKLGKNQALVVSDVNTIKECLTTNDKIFASRPNSLPGKLLGYDCAVYAVSPYGNHWRHFRKITVLELLSNKKVESLCYIRETELKASIMEMYSHKNTCLNMEEWFSNLSLNVIMKLVFGKRYSLKDEEGVKIFKMLRKVNCYLAMYGLSDVNPFLKWLDLGGNVKSMKKLAKELDFMLEKWLNEHKIRRKENVQINPEEQDFAHVMINLLEQASPEDLSCYSPDTINKATCLGLLLGASDTTTETLRQTLILLLKYPEELKKVTKEIDEKIGSQKMVQESDIKNLEYLQVVVKETMRLYPPAPLSFLHASTADCTVAGYSVPKGTHLLLNLHKLQRDRKVWSSPEEFQPERFLTTRYKDIDVKGQNFELIPFGSGRRICPGITFGLNMVHLTLANLIHSFEFVKTSVDDSLDVLFTPRLSHQLYEC